MRWHVVLSRDIGVSIMTKLTGRLALAAALLGLLASATGQANAGLIPKSAFSPSATDINFDNLMGGTSLFTGEVVTNQYQSLGVVFNDPDYPARANTTLTPFLPAASPPNVLFVQQHDGTAGRPLQILFSVPVTMAGFDFGGSVGTVLEVSVYDTHSTLLEKLTVTGTPGINTTGFFGDQEAVDIGRLDVSSLDGDPTMSLNFFIDNLISQSAVPEPTSAIMALSAALMLITAWGLCRLGGRAAGLTAVARS
jgi:hypothetical protein